MTTLTLKRIILIDLQSLLPINVNMVGHQLLEFKMHASNSKTNESQTLAPLKFKNYKKESKNDMDLFN